jgi:tRNA pseudouridine55 synthase
VSRHRKRGRAVSGIVLLDKPTGVQSNAALQRVKWLYQARKAGHTGSLDNLASGLLPICLGEATKLSGYLLDASKCYLSRFTLGTTTTTGDAQGDALTLYRRGPYFRCG